MMGRGLRKEAERILGENLRTGEKILWQSGTEPFGLLEGMHGRQVVRRWLLALAAVVSMAALYLAAAREPQRDVPVILALVLAVLLVSPAREWRRLQSQWYALTNQRALLIRGDRMVFSMEMGDIDDAQIVRFSPLETCLLLGSRVVAEPEQQLRWRAAHPMEDVGESPTIRGLVFYGIRDAERALGLVSRQVAG